MRYVFHICNLDTLSIKRAGGGEDIVDCGSIALASMSRNKASISLCGRTSASAGRNGGAWGRIRTTDTRIFIASFCLENQALVAETTENGARHCRGATSDWKAPEFRQSPAGNLPVQYGASGVPLQVPDGDWLALL
jgi:hypothetical protein